MGKGEIDGVAKELGLSGQVRRRARIIYGAATKADINKPIPRKVLVAASLYLGCRETKTPVTLRDLARASGAEPSEIGRCYMSLLKKMGISRPDLDGIRYLYHLRLNRPISKEAFRRSEVIIKRAAGTGCEGRNPMTLAAAALYLACCSIGEKVTQDELAKAAGVGVSSVMECCRNLRAFVSMPGA